MVEPTPSTPLRAQVDAAFAQVRSLLDHVMVLIDEEEAAEKGGDHADD